mmetsp:Transcript_21553/g.31886  ORF Transcript_21553/g.31886 Transcript_21553/m.31886 type:complete len:325 (-) Transcript_21553:22-996(-)
MVMGKRLVSLGLLTTKAFSLCTNIRGSTMSSIPILPAEDITRSLYETRDLYETDVHAIIRCRCDDGDDPLFRLSYMPIRNRGEIIRLILEEAQVPYEVEVIGFLPWKNNGLKASTPHGKLPVLRNYDDKGNDLGQEGAITRFLASKCGLAGKTEEERAEVDALYSIWFATFRNNGLSHDGEHFSVAALKQGDDNGDVKTIQDVIRYQEMFRVNSFSRFERSLTVLRFFEERLEDQSTGFLVGDSPTYVDLGLFYILFELAEEDNVPDFASRFKLPKLGAFLQNMQERPHLLDYLKNARRMPRYQRDSSGKSLYTFVAGKYSPEY